MLRIIESKSASGAKKYFDDGLRKEGVDYYLGTDQDIPGLWGGRAAEMLGLSGQVNREAFHALCDNLHPVTGERLTARNADGRRCGFDLTFNAPKDLSVIFELTGDEAILSAFRMAVRETMEEIEQDMQTRVRKGKQDTDRHTGNLVYGEFTHRTTRPPKSTGLPEMHMHAHVYCFNATYDFQEKQWKAGQFGNIKRDAPYYEAAFHSRLAGHLAAFYRIERHAKGWGIAGMPQTVIDKFSSRTREIEAEAKAKGITSAKGKDQLGAKTRSRKRKDLGMEALRKEWAERLTPGERLALDALRDGGGGAGAPVISDRQAMDYALAHGFERHSVVTEREVMAQALRHGVGSVTVEGVRSEAARGDVLARDVEGRKHVTTKAVLAEEKAMIETVKRGRGKCAPLGKRSFVFEPGRLNEEQKEAVNHVLRSRDAVTGISGGAGVGKTTLMREAVRGIEEGGKRVFTFAPTADASRGVLRAEGFENANTVAALLSSAQLQDQIKGQVVWIDEAGLLGAKTTAQMFKLAEEKQARVILSGDIGQHRSVERGDALRLLESKAGLKMARVREIQRQKGSYKQAVAAISKGDLAQGFERLGAMGAVVEMADDRRYKALAGEYAQAVKAGKTVLAVAPTHAEGARVTDAVRAELRAAPAGKGKKPMLEVNERLYRRLENLQLTEAQRGDARQYQPGLVVQFTQKAKGFENGEQVGVVAIAGNKVEVVNNRGRNVTLPLDQAGRFQVYRESQIALAVGEKIRITQNGFSVPDNGKGKGHRLNNGALYEVAGMTKAGDVKLNNGWVVRRDYGHVAYGYCATSHASQGKTVDRVLIAQSAASLRAASKEQFYVSVSRGREAVRIFTDDKQALREAVADSSARMSATELMEKKPGRNVMGRSVERQTELLRQLGSLAKIHAARAVEAVKDAAKEKARSWVGRAGKPQKRMEMEME